MVLMVNGSMVFMIILKFFVVLVCFVVLKGFKRAWLYHVSVVFHIDGFSWISTRYLSILKKNNET